MEPTLENERNSAVIVHQNYGFGQVLWIGIDSTWRWRHRLGDQYHHRFWGQLGRWAADNKTVAGNDIVRFGPDKTDIEVGDDVLIRARWLGGFLKQHPGLQANVEIHQQNKQKTGKLIATFDMKPSQGRPLVFEARAVSLPAGEYKLTLSATGADIGLAFDGDADRCFAVDERGEAVSPSAIAGLVAARELARAHAAGESDVAVIHNLITSRAVPELVAEHGGRAVRTRVGHSFIKQTMAETGAVFGGEHSAHYYFRDFWKADSGMLAALHLLAALGEHRAAAAGATVSGPGAGSDVPVSVITRDAGVLDRIDGWGWTPGLLPPPDAPPWPMAGFRDRFLAAFS